jgi:hypothetical protein
MGWACLDSAIGLSGDAAMLDRAVTSYSFSTDTSVALMIAKTVSPSLRFIRCTEPVVITDVTVPAAVVCPTPLPFPRRSPAHEFDERAAI